MAKRNPAKKQAVTRSSSAKRRRHICHLLDRMNYTLLQVKVLKYAPPDVVANIADELVFEKCEQLRNEGKKLRLIRSGGRFDYAA